MKRLCVGLGLATLILSLTVACSSGSSGPSCEDVCGKMQECDPEENYTECVATCDEFSGVMRDGVYEALGNCYMDQTCVFLAANEDYCFEAAMAEGSLPASRSLIERVCETVVPCVDDENYTQQDCVDDQTGASEGFSDDMYYTMSMFSDAVLDCIGDCVEETACVDLLENGVEDCMDDCGLDFIMSGDDVTNPGTNSPDA